MRQRETCLEINECMNSDGQTCNECEEGYSLMYEDDRKEKKCNNGSIEKCLKE